MDVRLFRIVIALLGLAFAAAFIALCVPPLIENPDFLGAALAGFVNPFSSGYALDAIFCWMILAVWVVHEAKTQDIKHGWVCLVLGVVPGVATGFAAYLLLRTVQTDAAKN